MNTSSYPLWCPTHQKHYRCQRYLHSLTEDRLVFIHQREYAFDAAPLSWRILAEGLLGFIWRKKIQNRQADLEAQFNLWYAIVFDRVSGNYELTGPYPTRAQCENLGGRLIQTGSHYGMMLQSSTYAWTPFSDMIDGPEDYCALSLTLSFETAPHPDFESHPAGGAFDCLEDWLEPGPRFFGNAIHVDDPRVKARKKLLAGFC